MKKLLFLTALALIGCDNYTPNQEPKVIEKKVIVHDTITKYMTHECSKEYGVEATEVNGKTFVIEIHRKSNDEIVYFIEPWLIIQRIEKQGGSNFEYDVEDSKEHIIITMSFKFGKEKHGFTKTWPKSNYYIMETFSNNFASGSLTVSNPIPRKDGWD